MKQIGVLLAAATLGALSAPARAVPPTVTPSPGYDARLQESRAGAATAIHPPALRRPKPKPKKPPPQ